MSQTIQQTTHAPHAQEPAAQARLIRISSTQSIALSLYHALELIEHPQVIQVPGLEGFVYGMMSWQGRWIPLIDVFALVCEQPIDQTGNQTPNQPNHAANDEHANSPLKYAMVVGYRTVDEKGLATIKHGAIHSTDIPKTITVTNAIQSKLPSYSTHWQRIAMSCIEHEGQTVPIVATEKLFSK